MVILCIAAYHKYSTTASRSSRSSRSLRLLCLMVSLLFCLHWKDSPTFVSGAGELSLCFFLYQRWPSVESVESGSEDGEWRERRRNRQSCWLWVRGETWSELISSQSSTFPFAKEIIWRPRTRHFSTLSSRFWRIYINIKQTAVEFCKLKFRQSFQSWLIKKETFHLRFSLSEQMRMKWGYVTQ